MLLRQMKYFVTVVENKSFTEAAEKLFISQSAVSQQIQSLENELGVQLLERKVRNFSLTPAGEYFYRRSKSFLNEAENIKNETISIGNTDENELNIGFLNILDSEAFRKTINTFTTIYPEIILNVYSGTHEELYNRLRNKEIDLIIGDQRRAFSDDYFNFELISAPMYIEINKNNSLSNLDSIELNDLKYLTGILVTPQNKLESEISYYHNSLGFNENFIGSNSLDEARLLLLSNRGFLPLEKVGHFFTSEKAIKRIPVYQKNKPIFRNYCAFWPKDRTNYYIEEFAHLLKANLSQK